MWKMSTKRKGPEGPNLFSELRPHSGRGRIGEAVSSTLVVVPAVLPVHALDLFTDIRRSLESLAEDFSEVLRPIIAIDHDSVVCDVRSVVDEIAIVGSLDSAHHGMKLIHLTEKTPAWT